MSEHWKPFYLRSKFLLISAAIVLGLVGLQLLSGFAGRIPQVSGSEAKALIAQGDKPLVLIVVVQGNVMSRGMTTIMERLAEDTGDSYRFAQIDPAEAQALGVKDTPVVLVYDKGQLRAQRPIIESKEDLVALLK